jgi:hypothetical protein
LSAHQTIERQLRAILAGLPDDVIRFREACARVVDWDAMLRAAHEQSVASVVFAGAERAQVSLPLSVAKDAVARLRLGAVWRDALHDTLRKVLRALNEQGVPSVALKGPLLALRLYEGGVVRPSEDLDLLLAPGSLDAATQALAPLGYERESGDVERFYHEHHHHVRMLHAALPTIELHFHAYRGFGTVLPAAPLLARAIPCNVPGWLDACVLSPEDEFLYLAVHAASHRFQSLVWLFDLKLLALRHPDLRWDELIARSKSYGFSSVVSFAVALLSEWLGLELPRGLPHLPPVGSTRALAAQSLIRPPSTYAVNAVETFIFTLLLCDDIAHAGAYSRSWGSRGLARARAALSSTKV